MNSSEMHYFFLGLCRWVISISFEISASSNIFFSSLKNVFTLIRKKCMGEILQHAWKPLEATTDSEIPGVANSLSHSVFAVV